MKEIRPCAEKTQADLALEWDKMAEERHRQIASGEDLSFDHVVVPTLFQLLDGADPKRILDIGSGTGDFTARLARVAGEVIGIEPSRRSVTVARTNCIDIPNVRFIEAPVEAATEILAAAPGTSAVACMTLMTTPNLETFAKGVAASLLNDSKLVAVMSHPWFWPKYWQYETEPWFSYSKEIFIEAPFVISRCRTKIITTHIHRPLEQYVRTFATVGFRLEALLEPMPPAEIQALYPQRWQFPRFIGLRWVKIV